MWLVTRNGMFSAVQDRTNRNILSVRSRVRSDSQFLSDWCRTHKPKGDRRQYKIKVSGHVEDYPFRVFVPRTLFATFTSEQVMQDLTYGNFKAAVGARQGWDREKALHEVWDALAALEYIDPAPRPGGPGWAARGSHTARNFGWDRRSLGAGPVQIGRAWNESLTSGPTLGDEFFDGLLEPAPKTAPMRLHDGDELDGPADCWYCTMHTLDPAAVDISGDPCPMSGHGMHGWIPSEETSPRR